MVMQGHLCCSCGRRDGNDVEVSTVGVVGVMLMILRYIYCSCGGGDDDDVEVHLL